MSRNLLLQLLDDIERTEPEHAPLVEEVRKGLEAGVLKTSVSGGESMEFEASLYFLVKLLREQASQSDAPIVLRIGGGTASGKTTLAHRLVAELGKGQATLLLMDDYYYGVDYMKENPELTWDDPEAVDLKTLAENVQALSRGKSVEKPVYDMYTSTRSGYEQMSPPPILIVEGIFALHPKLEACGGITVYVDTSFEACLYRRLLRDQTRKGKKTAEILDYMWNVIRPLHFKYVDPSKKGADYLVSNEAMMEV